MAYVQTNVYPSAQEAQRVLNELGSKSAAARHFDLKRTSFVVFCQKHGLEPESGPTGNSELVVGDKTPEPQKIDALLKARGMDPEDWVVDSATINEWESPTGEALQQTKATVRRKKPLGLVLPATEPTTYKAPPRVAPDPTQPRSFIFIGDHQVPFYDEQMHYLVCSYLAQEQPTDGIYMGDLLDLPDLSRYRKHPNFDATAQDCINTGYKILRDYREASPNTNWTMLRGNHEDRLRNLILDHNANLYGIRPADIPGEDHALAWHDFAHLLRLEDLGFDWSWKDSPDDTYDFDVLEIAPKLAAVHGDTAKAGSTHSALATVKRVGHSVVMGHVHRLGVGYYTIWDELERAPKHFTAAETGTCALIRKGLGHSKRPDWQNGWINGTVWPDGYFHLSPAIYVNGEVLMDGRRYAESPKRKLRAVA